MKLSTTECSKSRSIVGRKFLQLSRETRGFGVMQITALNLKFPLTKGLKEKKGGMGHGHSEEERSRWREHWVGAAN